MSDDAQTDRPLRVLAVTNMYPHATAPTYGSFVEAQVAGLRAAGVQVEVEFINGRASDWAYIAAIQRVRRLARSTRFDVVHAHYGLCGFVCVFQPLPLVLSYWGDDLLGTPNGRGGLTRKSRLIRRISFLAARRADAINCESEEMRAQLPRRADRRRASVIPTGINLQRFHPGQRAAARTRLGLNPRERLILFPSTPTERRKRIDLARAAVEMVNRWEGGVQLWVVQGTAPKDMPDCYRAADCLLLTSDWEGSANVVKEAVCCDLPVVSVDAGDARRWIALSPGCELVERNVDAIGHALRRVLAGDRRVDGTRVREELAIEKTAARIKRLYEEAIVSRNHRRRRACTGRHSRA